MNPDVTTHWAFGGFLSEPLSHAAWAGVAAAAGLGMLLTWLSYRRATPALTALQRLALAGLRSALIVTLLVCLANPTRIERTPLRPPAPPPPSPRRLAVLVDRSDSMTQPDNRGRTRQEDAVARWRKLEPAAGAAFAQTRYYSFAGDLQTAASLDQALARTGNTDQTRLYGSVTSLLNAAPGERPAAVVVLTDGLDTSESSATVLRDAALAAQVPVYFVPGSNHRPPAPFLRVREWRIPPQVMRNTQIELNLTFEAYALAGRMAAFSLWVGDRRWYVGHLELSPGSNLIPFRFAINSGEPATRDIVLRLGENAADPVAARAIMVVQPSPKVRVLIYQGALDWGLRTLIDALQGDPSFAVTAQFAAASTDADFSSTLENSNGAQLPGQVAGYRSYDCVVLARFYPAALDAAQQQALVDYVREGGGLLFSNPDPSANGTFDGTPLAELLPVRLVPPADSSAQPAAFVPDLSIGGFDRTSPAIPPLEAFSLTPAGLASPIFTATGGGHLLPKFVQFDASAGAKSGAEVLAVRPGGRETNTGSPAILLATQIVGRGHTAFLATDGLWRWKLGEPSTSRLSETFWQQLILAIRRPVVRQHLHFLNPPGQVGANQTASLRLGGADSHHRPSILATAPDGTITPLTVENGADAEASWKADWKPVQAGGWKLTAAAEGDVPDYAFVPVLDEPVGERAPTPTATEAMRDLAVSTGGALLTATPPPNWRAPEAERTPDPIEHEERRLLWNTWPVLSLALGLFAAELGLRRRWKLI